MHETKNDFDALKNAYCGFTRFVGPLESELAKNGCGSQTLVTALTECAAKAAKQVVEFQGQTFLPIYGQQPNELISSVIAKCAKLGIVL